jgi:hypothetical protein
MKTKLSVAAAALTLGLIGSAQALPNQATFTAAGLGAIGGWTLIGAPETFGIGGNGFLSSGGTAEYELRLADHGHRFGTSNTNHFTGISVIFDTAVDAPGAVDSWAPANNPFLFFFQTKNCCGAGNDEGVIWSDNFRDDDPANQLDMAIYQNNADPNLFALFFDDGGPNSGFLGLNDDDDFNDMVVTVRAAAVAEPGALALLGIGLTALGYLGRRRKSA